MSNALVRTRAWEVYVCANMTYIIKPLQAWPEREGRDEVASVFELQQIMADVNANTRNRVYWETRRDCAHTYSIAFQKDGDKKKKKPISSDRVLLPRRSRRNRCRSAAQTYRHGNKQYVDECQPYVILSRGYERILCSECKTYNARVRVSKRGFCKTAADTIPNGGKHGR